MLYPPTPWTLNGFAFQTLHWIDVARASPFVPLELEIVNVVPGKTIGGVYLSQYGAGSQLQYNELIVVAALVKRGHQIAPWISHIYVDNPASIAGGRELWGLPKEEATFSWAVGEPGQVVVRRQEQELCAFRTRWRLSLWRQRIAFPSFSQLAGQFLLFKCAASANFGLIGSDLDIAATAPFASLIHQKPLLAVSADSLVLQVEQPEAGKNP